MEHIADVVLKSALEQMPNFVVVDSCGTIIFMNENHMRLMGTTKEKVLGAKVTDVLPNTRLMEVLKTGRAEIGYVITLYDHTKKCNVEYVCNRIPIIRNGKTIGAMAVTILEGLDSVTQLQKEIESMRRKTEHYRQELARLKNPASCLDQIIGKSSKIEEIKKMIVEYAPSNLSILIRGETGVGKELFARAVHNLSPRSVNNYVKINCAAIPENLLESELFGYMAGTFTGGNKNGKKGKFEMADGGTILLDEIGEMSMDLQAKLLRVLQEKEIEPVGALNPIPIDVRIVCSTNRILEKLIKTQKFREDLFYRINTVQIVIPPLRERMEDVEPLVKFFVDKTNREAGYAIESISRDALDVLHSHSWPGNVRELQHVIERASVRCKAGVLRAEHVDFLETNFSMVSAAQQSMGAVSILKTSTQQAESKAILAALEATAGNKTKAAKLLGIDRSRLYSKIRKYGIEQ